MKPMVFSLKKF